MPPHFRTIHSLSLLIFVDQNMTQVSQIASKCLLRAPKISKYSREACIQTPILEGNEQRGHQVTASRYTPSLFQIPTLPNVRTRLHQEVKDILLRLHAYNIIHINPIQVDIIIHRYPRGQSSFLDMHIGRFQLVSQPVRPLIIPVLPIPLISYSYTILRTVVNILQ